LDHFGFEVDDVDAIFARVQDDFPTIEWLKRPTNRPFAGIGMHDPAGNVFDLSQAGMENRRGIYDQSSNGVHPRHIDHIFLRTVDPELVARFYIDVLGLTPREKPTGDPNHYLTDGQMTLVVAPWHITDYAGSGIERPASEHIGFVVEDMDAFRSDLAALIEKNPAMAPRPKKGDEAEARVKLLSQCHYGEFQLCDPDGVLLDVRAG
jgi:catechol 2,3-dioxygenase-like lactoylglutathione lyase family enzyme